MFAEFFVMFRESLEAVIILGILLTYLSISKNQKYNKFVFAGAAAGLIASVLAAFIFERFLGGFEGSEELFEGIVMITSSIFVTWLLVWVFDKGSAHSIQESAKKFSSENSVFGFFILSFVAVFREGVESVLFIYGIYSGSGTISLLGGLLGVLAAIIFGYLVFVFSMKFNFAAFFKFSAVLLVLLAAGLFSRGIHELQEANVLPTYSEHVFDINPPQNPDGSYPILHEKGTVGVVFSGLVGYDGNPSDLQVLGYISYVILAYFLYLRSCKKIS